MKWITLNGEMPLHDARDVKVGFLMWQRGIAVRMQPTVEVKTMDREALPLVNQGERDETASAEKLPNQATLGSNTERETESKQTEPPAVELKDIDEDPVVDVPVQNKREEEKDSVPVSHTKTSPEPVAEAIDNQPVEQQATESVVKEEVERPDVASSEKEQQEQTNTVGASESSVEAIEKPQQRSEVLHVQESEAVPAKDVEDSVVSIEVDKPETIVAEVDQKVEDQYEMNPTAEVELKVEEQPEINNQAEILEPVEFLPAKTPEVVGEYSIEDSKTETKEADGPELTVPEFKVKLEELSEVTNQDEKTESVIPEVEVKLDRQSESSEQVQSGSIERETSKDEGMLAGKVEDTTLGKEGKTSEQKESSEIPEPVISTNQNSQADVLEDKVGFSPAVLAEEDEKKEMYRTEPVEVPSKVAVGEGEKIKEEEEAKNKATEVDVQRELPNEELAEPIKVEEVKNAVSKAEVSAKQFEGKKIGEVVKPVAENKKDEIIIGERSALVETDRDENIELDETAKTNEDKLEKENIEETVKSDVQISEPSTKDGKAVKAPQDLTPKVPVKPPQKQSSNILTKVKQSLVKAKKAIIGKSPSPKTVFSDAKDDINVK